MSKVIRHHTRKAALDFFERFDAYSAEWVRGNLPRVHRSWPTRNCHDIDDWRGGAPVGAILHYTAGVNFGGTIRHFVEGGRVSAHWVISKGRDSRADGLREQFGLDGDLHVDAIQCVHPKRPAWHAGWVNRICVGTEHRNAGILRAYPKDPPRGMPRKPERKDALYRDEFFRFGDLDVDELDFYWWPEGWTTPFVGEVLKINGSWWETWSRGQLATNINILRYLNSANELDPSWLLAHHQVKESKNDVVHPVPLDKFREAVLFSNKHVDDLEWLAEFDDCNEIGYEEDDPWMLHELDERQIDRGEEDLDDFDPEDFDGNVMATEVPEALRQLGFYVPEKGDERLHAAVRIYQRGRNLHVDGVAGPATRAALRRDLKVWRIGYEI